MIFSKRSFFNRKRPAVIFTLILIMLSSLLPVQLACSNDTDNAVVREADYGSAGTDFAEELARKYPRRVPGSEQEAAASALISERLNDMGYVTELQKFSFFVGDDQLESQNVIAKLSGNGFVYAPQFEADRDATAAERIDDRIMIIGAHYDTPAFTVPADSEGAVSINTADGIHNNASGVAAVLTAAKQMEVAVPGYDIHIVFFGAGTNRQEGARAYLNSLSEDELSRVEVMVNVGPIYAGDKIYAHAGQNSVEGGSEKNYLMRRKLYQLTDIFFEHMLNTKNGYAIYTNQSNFTMPYKSGEGEASQTGVYREWTVLESDHSPFDRAGIPVVFIESGDYNVTDKEELGMENRSPRFSSSEGMISGSLFDETEFLREFFRSLEKEADVSLPTLNTEDIDPTGINNTDEITTNQSGTGIETEKIKPDRLTMRINNTAFVLVELARRGPVNYSFDQ